MQTDVRYGKLTVKDGRIICPNCKRKTSYAVRAETNAEHMPLWCKFCKAKYLMNIERGQCYMISQCP